MKRVFIIGAGQIGSRHLQALAKVRERLEITVVEPVKGSVKIAKDRFREIPGYDKHEVAYIESIPQNAGAIDLAIVATTSATRRQAIEDILKAGTVRYFILEKLLFQKEKDYSDISALIRRSGSTAWVNCMMRSIPFYHDMKTEIQGEALTYIVNRSDTTLTTSAIHYLDHLIYLTGCSDFEIDTSHIDRSVRLSKRQGFYELTGTLGAAFKDGSVFSFVSYFDTSVPARILIYNSRSCYLVNEDKQKAIVFQRETGWRSEETPIVIPHQSERTTSLVEEILISGTCPLVSFDDSVKTHLALLRPLLAFFNSITGKNLDYFPFT